MSGTIDAETGSPIDAETGSPILSDAAPAPGSVTTPPLQPFSAADYAFAFQALFPRGRAWPRDPDALQTAVAAALTPTYARADASAVGLIADSFPATTDYLLPEWEATLGLPDPCLGANPTTAQRRAQVVARFVSAGGQSISFFLQYAATLGYVGVTITQYTPRRFGQPFNGLYYNDPWAFVWLVGIPVANIQAGGAGYGGNALQCEFERMKPAHTWINFTITGGQPFVLGTNNGVLGQNYLA